MGVPHKKFKTRPKKSGAKKRRRILEQKRRLIAAGLEEKHVNRLTAKDIRKKLKEVAKRRAPKGKKTKK